MKPTHTLSVLNKVTDEKGKIGAAWLNPNGSISIVLNPCVVMQANKDMVYTLFPTDETPNFNKPGIKTSRYSTRTNEPMPDDDRDNSEFPDPGIDKK